MEAFKVSVIPGYYSNSSQMGIESLKFISFDGVSLLFQANFTHASVISIKADLDLLSFTITDDSMFQGKDGTQLVDTTPVMKAIPP